MEKNKKQFKMLSPKLDIVFQALFGEVGSERITKRFLESILNKKIEAIDLSKNPILRREYIKDKLGVLDIIAKINEKEHCNIEMQLVDTGDIIERMLYYWSRIYSRQIQKGEEYQKLEKTIVILIADFTIKSLENLMYHTEWKIIDMETKKVILTNKLELHIIEMPKIKEVKEQDELLDWLQFLENPKSERVEIKMQENEELKEAVNKLQGMSEDEYMQRIADLREKAILDENSLRNNSIRYGIEKGKMEEKLEIAKRMLEERVDIELIIKITGLPEEEIKKINTKIL